MFRASDFPRFYLLRKIVKGDITIAGNRPAKIYGRLDCKSGKRMKHESRVFFVNVTAAERAGYRPCGHCMREEYKKWICSQG